MCLECGNDCAGGHTWILAGVNLGEKICQQSFRCFDIHFLEASWSKDYERHGHHSGCSAALVINYEFDIRILDLDCADAWSIRLAWLLSKLFKMMRGCDRLVVSCCKDLDQKHRSDLSSAYAADLASTFGGISPRRFLNLDGEEAEASLFQLKS